MNESPRFLKKITGLNLVKIQCESKSLKKFQYFFLEILGSIKVRSNNERSKSLRGPNFLKSLIRWITSESIVVALPGALEMRQFYSLSSGALFIRTLWATPKFSFLLPLLKIHHFFEQKTFSNHYSHKPSERPTAEEILEILNEEKSKKRFGYDLFDIKPVRMPEKVNAREILSRLPGRDIFSLWKLSSSDLYR